ncbi:hypothetical protein ALT785_390009 [Alteromonas infernus]
MISIYNYYKVDSEGRFKKNDGYDPNSPMDLYSFLTNQPIKNWIAKEHTLEAYSTLDNGVNADLVFAVDVPSSVKNFERSVRENLGIDININELKTLNKSKSNVEVTEIIRVFLVDEISQWVAHTFKKEIELFGYKNPYN